MRTHHVQDLALEVWELREKRSLKSRAAVLGRLIYQQVAADIAECDDYDPTADDRVEWLQQLARTMKTWPYRLQPMASADLEMRVAVLIGKWDLIPCGKDRACGA